MGQPDDGGALENRVNGAEAQDLSFGATGGGAAEAGTDLAQLRVTPAARELVGPRRGGGGYRLHGRPSRERAHFSGDRG